LYGINVVIINIYIVLVYRTCMYERMNVCDKCMCELVYVMNVCAN